MGWRNNDKICINISTVNSCFKGTILNLNVNFIKWVCNKKFIQFEYIKNNLIRKSEAHKNRVTKCNENQSKEETKNKAPKIINTGKYMIHYLSRGSTENSLTTIIIKSINKTYLFFKPIIQNES